MTSHSCCARLSMTLAIAMLLSFAPAAGAWTVACPSGYTKNSAGQCVKSGGGGQQGQGSQSQFKPPTQQNPQQQQKPKQQQQNSQQQQKPKQQQQKPQQQQQGRSAGCSQAYANCNAVCSQNFAAHRNQAAYNACMTNCNLGYNTCR
ncbi:hypothetical protein DGI_1451 [Megalodesulfovibrio gigas DSM 1382 = ATCC 19364]|uniref:Uncharacterized protein n=2 Tax=Megalodesulfovibrio gigas TaxID=879 RepID=T2G9M3_MEGG1|nr:hypothetical protein DGI_1451 [Megalodesulfovibrio gigas DSM 1382 = ATCC 19364]